jgi:hypothetical protein
MAKKLTLNCTFKNGSTSPMDFYVGEAANGSHPIQFQSQWLATQFGGKVPKEIMESLAKLKEISETNRINFEDLCEYTFKEVNAANAIKNERIRTNKQIEYVAKRDNIKETSYDE